MEKKLCKILVNKPKKTKKRSLERLTTPPVGLEPTTS